jgi:xanthine dehydrogenase YagS FAD-binding subunit
MQNFEYANPATLKEAAELLNADSAVLAGGTDLLSSMKDYIATPKRVVNIKGIKELGGITKTAKGLRIGATVTLDELAANALVKAMFPSLATAAMGIASPQIRNMGTVGGDLCQRPRCWYFRQGHGLLGQDKFGKQLVPTGENRYHAIFGGGPAYFVSPSSFGPALAALGAKVKMFSAQYGAREMSMEEFFVIPKNNITREIALLPNEVLTEILIPAPAATSKNATYEIRHREAVDWPLATASVSLTMKGSTVQSASIVLGHVAPAPWKSAAAEASIAGKSISAETAEAAGMAAVADAKPLSQNAYKVQLAKVAVKRALLAAAGVKG